MWEGGDAGLGAWGRGGGLGRGGGAELGVERERAATAAQVG